MATVPTNFGSTTFNNRITSYDLLAQRVQRQLGAPLIQIESAAEMLYENIDIACEFFTKFAGYTEEYLVFNSSLYTPGVGLYLGRLFNITPQMSNSDTFTTAGTGVSSTMFTLATALSASWDYDLNEQRKVIDIFSMTEGQNNGVNTLFTIEQTVAQQAYFGHLLGSMGFDLITWHMMASWLDLRKKLLATEPYLRFNPYTQILQIIPEPRTNEGGYYGLVGAYVQLAIKDIVSQSWVSRYVLALTKQSVAHVRGKFSGTSLFGGQNVNFSDLMTQGVADQAKLEDELTKNYVDSRPVGFFVG